MTAMWIVLAVVMPLWLLWLAYECKPERRDRHDTHGYV